MTYEYDLFFNSVSKFYEIYKDGRIIFKAKDINLVINVLTKLLGGDWSA